VFNSDHTPVQLLWLVLSGVALSPGEVLQPPQHGLHQVPQVRLYKVSLVRTACLIASSIEVAAPEIFSVAVACPCADVDKFSSS
jgi:hypothetical protein